MRTVHLGDGRPVLVPEHVWARVVGVDGDHLLLSSRAGVRRARADGAHRLPPPAAPVRPTAGRVLFEGPVQVCSRDPLACPACAGPRTDVHPLCGGGGWGACACGYLWRSAATDAWASAVEAVACPGCGAGAGLSVWWLEGAPGATAWASCGCGHRWEPLWACRVASSWAR